MAKLPPAKRLPTKVSAANAGRALLNSPYATANVAGYRPYEAPPDAVQVKGTKGTEGKEAAVVARENAAATAAAANSGAVPDYGLQSNVTDGMYMEDPTKLGTSARSGVTADPAAIAAQQKAMNELFGLYDQGGATATERARMAATRADEDQYLRSQREAHQQDLTERGMDGSGAEIAALLGDRQAAGQRMSMANLQTEQMLQDRALSALMEGNKAAGQIRTSSFDEGQARGKATDEFSVLNNNLINGAAQSNKDWLRQTKADIEGKKYDSWQAGLDRGVNAAQGLMGFDANENKTGYTMANDAAKTDAGAFNDASGRVGDAVKGLAGDARDNFAANTGKDATFSGAREDRAASYEDTAQGVGGVSQAAADAVSAGASGGATEFDPKKVKK